MADDVAEDQGGVDDGVDGGDSTARLVTRYRQGRKSVFTFISF